MKLDFRLLVIDDQPDEIEDAIEMLRMDLEEKGFRLLVEIALDISEKGIDAYCQAGGRNFDLARLPPWRGASPSRCPAGRRCARVPWRQTHRSLMRMPSQGSPP